MFLNNRELAIGIWVIIAFIIFSLKRDFRKSAFSIPKILLSKNMLVLYIFMFIYIVIALSPLYLIGFNYISNIKIIIKWIFCIAFIMLFRYNKVYEGNFFRHILKSSVRFLVILEFIVAKSVFNLVVELILVPVFALLGGLIAVAEMDQKLNKMKIFYTHLIIFINVLIVSLAIYYTLINLKDFANKNNIIDLLLPIVLTILFAPFIYLLALYARYEEIFIRMKISIKDKKLLHYAEKRVLLSFGANVYKLSLWSKKVNYSVIDNKDSIKDEIKKYQNKNSDTN